MYFKLSPQVLEKTLNHLASRPWSEVNIIINELIKLEKVNEENTKSNNSDGNVASIIRKR